MPEKRIDRLETDMAEVKKDIIVIKSDIVVMKGDIATLKKDMDGVKSDIVVMKEDIAVIKSNYVTRAELYSALGLHTRWLMATIIGSTGAAMAVAKAIF